MNYELWKKAVSFHGHECPGLAIGVKVCEAAIEKLNIKFSNDEEITCIVENDACGVDAIQSILGCTIGKGNLLYKDTGKHVYSIFNRSKNESIRIYFKVKFEKRNKIDFQNYLLNAPIEELFEFSTVKVQVPEKAKIFRDEVCAKCGECIPEHKAHIEDGKIVCVDCFKEYKRGW